MGEEREVSKITLLCHLQIVTLERVIFHIPHTGDNQHLPISQNHQIRHRKFAGVQLSVLR